VRLLFVRHGEPDYEHDCLTPEGHRQARAAAGRLREENISQLFSSPFGRAKETAAYTSEALGLPVTVLDFMHELYWGSRDGARIFAGGHPWNIADAMAREGWDLSRQDWREHPYFSNNTVTAGADFVGAEIDAWLGGFGIRREGRYYRSEQRNDETVAVFCHGGSSAAALGHILDITFPHACALFHLDFTGITAVRFPKPGAGIALPTLALCNDARHIF